MALESYLKGWVSRILPQAESDNDPGLVRLGRYGDLITVGAVRKQHGLADEGSYFVCNNAGTGVATTATPTAFTDTAPMVSLYNSDSPANQGAKRLHLDWIRLTETAAGTAGVTFRAQAKIGSGNPFSSGGTDMQPVSPNMDVPNRASIAIAKLLPTAVAMQSARTIVGDVYAIPTQGVALPVSTTILLNFGGVETAPQLLSTASISPVNLFAALNLPPIIIGPNQGFILNFLIGSQSAASSWTAEMGWWER
jgi:hypothetical protein